MIKSIETVYCGIKYRSRTEARWAMFFDLIGEKFIYEKEGFQLETGEFYLPDFWMCKYGFWVEIKGYRHAEEVYFEKLMRVCEGRNDSHAGYVPSTFGLIFYGEPSAFNGAFVGCEFNESSGGTISPHNNALIVDGGSSRGISVMVETNRDNHFCTADPSYALPFVSESGSKRPQDCVSWRIQEAAIAVNRHRFH